jgi:hypothetical protein
MPQQADIAFSTPDIPFESSKFAPHPFHVFRNLSGSPVELLAFSIQDKDGTGRSWSIRATQDPDRLSNDVRNVVNHH